MRLVLVHGRSQQGKDPDALKKEWTTALHEGFGCANVSPTVDDVGFAYYGDLLADLVGSIEKGLPSNLAERGPSSGPHSYMLAQREILIDLAAAAGVTDEEVSAELGDVQARDPQNWGWVLAVIRALSKIPGLDSRVIDTWIRDVSLYVTNSSVQRAVDRIVLSELGTGPFVLVTHSLGTVVGYNVLRSPDRNGRCRGLITLGSPLGISGIRTRLQTPVTYPPRLAGWFNAFDRTDIVALRPLNVNYFPTDPPIENYPEVRNSTPNRHGVTGVNARSSLEPWRLVDLSGLRVQGGT